MTHHIFKQAQPQWISTPLSFCLKKNIPAVILQNISPFKGLCNGTCITIQQQHKHLLKAKILSGSCAGQTVVFIPQIKLLTRGKDLPSILSRHQYPIEIAFAMTISKLQGKQLNMKGCMYHNQFLPMDNFMLHFQAPILTISIFIFNTDLSTHQHTANVVYKQILNS